MKKRKPYYDNIGTHKIRRLLPRHFKMLDLKVAGMSNRDIARTLECGTQTVNSVTRSPLFLMEYNRRMKEQNQEAIRDETNAFTGKVRSILEQNSEKAAFTQVDLLDSEDHSIRLRASGSILDRVLGKADAPGATPTRIELSGPDAKLLIIALQESSPSSQERISSNGQESHPTADSPSAESSSNGQDDVH